MLRDPRSAAVTAGPPPGGARGRRRVHPLPAAHLAFLLAALFAVLLSIPAPAQDEAAEEPAAEADAAPAAPVMRVRVDTIIHPVAAELVEDAVREADERGAAVLVLELSTPGGLLTSTREMFTAMLGARTPVVAYVAPSGAQAASAGFFLLMAADVAAMAPGTNTGAAHPVGGQGEDIEGTMGEKAEQDAAATIRSLAERHGRNAELAEAAVVESRSFTADEALDAGLVDLVAPSFQALLVALDGREVEKNGRTVTLRTAEAPVVEIELSPLRRVLSALAHPNIAYILLSLGFLGLYFELMNPGTILPGVVGAICLILAFFALSVLPFNFAGIALILLAILLFIAEIKVPSFGLLTVGGVVSLALGGLLLFKSPVPALRVSFDMIAGVALVALIVVAGLVRLAVKAQRNKVRTGSEGLVGEVGQAVDEIDPQGKVFVHGEYWHAVAAEPIPASAAVEVTGVRGMLLTVRPLAAAVAGRRRAAGELADAAPAAAEAER
jgi:membrane-bound serine protease (ClpP class)